MKLKAHNGIANRPPVYNMIVIWTWVTVFVDKLVGTHEFNIVTFTMPIVSADNIEFFSLHTITNPDMLSLK